MQDPIDRNALLAAIYDNPPEKADMTHAEWYLKCIHEAPTIAQEDIDKIGTSIFNAYVEE